VTTTPASLRLVAGLLDATGLDPDNLSVSTSRVDIGIQVHTGRDFDALAVVLTNQIARTESFGEHVHHYVSGDWNGTRIDLIRAERVAAVTA
jgi:hypothetical protein